MSNGENKWQAEIKCCKGKYSTSRFMIIIESPINKFELNIPNSDARKERLFSFIINKDQEWTMLV